MRRLILYVLRLPPLGMVTPGRGTALQPAVGPTVGRTDPPTIRAITRSGDRTGSDHVRRPRTSAPAPCSGHARPTTGSRFRAAVALSPADPLQTAIMVGSSISGA